MTTIPTPTTTPKVVHVYDDIEEEDNRLPNWWLFILFATIVFAFVYWFVYHTTSTLPNPSAVYRQEVDRLIQARIEASPTSPEALVALSRDETALAQGREVFTTTCAACHGPQGEGIIGPNLTDRFWIHPSGPADLHAMVQNGVPAKGMPPWGPILGPERTRAVTAYVMTLRGKNLPGKAPQGEPAD